VDAKELLKEEEEEKVRTSLTASPPVFPAASGCFPGCWVRSNNV